MIHDAVTGIIVVVAVLTAAYVETHGGDPTPYIGVATGAVGYAAGSVVGKARGKKLRSNSGT
jgi:hypothetical protein